MNANYPFVLLELESAGSQKRWLLFSLDRKKGILLVILEHDARD